MLLINKKIKKLIEEIKNNDNYKDFIDKSKEVENCHEYFGDYTFGENGFENFISVRGDIHGFDGIFKNKENQIFFYEAKYSRNMGYSFLLKKAKDTIQNPKKTRNSSIENVKDKYKNIDIDNKKSIDEIEFFDNILLSIKNNKKLPIKKSRQLINIGCHKKYNLCTKKTKNKIKEYKENIMVVEYE